MCMPFDSAVLLQETMLQKHLLCEYKDDYTKKSTEALSVIKGKRKTKKQTNKRKRTHIFSNREVVK